jgi:hypothetical protein
MGTPEHIHTVGLGWVVSSGGRSTTAQVLPTEQLQNAVMTAASASDRLWAIRRSRVSGGAGLAATLPNLDINPDPGDDSARPLDRSTNFVIA